MAFWLLERKDDIPKDLDPWSHNPYQAELIDLVVRASSEDEARKLAQKQGLDESAKGVKPWLDPSLTTCTELHSEGPADIISCNSTGV